MVKMTRCKYCNSQIPSSEKNCPYCGCKSIKLYDIWWVWAISFFVVAGIVIGLAIKFPYPVTKPANSTASMQKDVKTAEDKKASQDIKASKDEKGTKAIKATEDEKATKDEKATVTENAPTTDNTPKFSDGQYIVGKDIKAGLYKVTLTDTKTKVGYIERASSADMSAASILANITFMGDGYVKIKSTDVAVKLHGIGITPINYKNLTPNYKNEASSGTYLVGVDIKPGTYKIDSTATGTNKAYFARLSSVSMDKNDIIKYQFFKGYVTVQILPTDVALHIQNATLTLVK